MTERKKCVFIIDSDIITLHTGKNALQPKFTVAAVQQLKNLRATLDKMTPDLILLDSKLPGTDGGCLLDELGTLPETAGVPVILLCDVSGPAEELSGLTRGAADTIRKPFTPALLRRKAELHLQTEALKRELQTHTGKEPFWQLQGAVVRWAADLLEFREDVTGNHAENIQRYLRIFTEAMASNKRYADEVSGWDVESFLQAAVLHDVGKIKIRDDVLLKRGRLTDEEFETLKTHPLHGKLLLESLPYSESNQDFLQCAIDIAYMHHEKWDGSGYPIGLKGEEIPLRVRMLMIVDVYDALVSERPYKKAFSHDEAMRIIYERRGSQFDPGLTDLFMSLSHEIGAR
ncbi:MAG: response regulator [Oscillospiraceae bacterium]|nr:response regulator [Oscillospiraceae bacterium]